MPKPTGEGIRKRRKLQRAIYLKNNRNLERTLKELGYVVAGRTLRSRAKLYFPKKYQSPETVNPEKYLKPRASDETKPAAVMAMRNTGRSVTSLAREFNVSRQTLYAWNREFPSPQKDSPDQAMAPKPTLQQTNEAEQPGSSEKQFDKTLKQVNNLERQVALLVRESEALREEIRQLQLQKDVPVKTAEILKKIRASHLSP